MHGPISFVTCDQSNHNQGSVCAVLNAATWLNIDVVTDCTVSPAITVCVAVVPDAGSLNV